MATRNQVLSLFGATPAQIQERQRQQQAEMILSQRDPYARTGAALGTALAGLFGAETPELAQARQMQEAVSGIDVNDPEALRALAQSVASFAPDRALQISAYAGELEKSMMGQTVNVPEIVGYEPDYKLNPLTQQYEQVGTKPVYRNIPYERTPQGLRRLEGLPDYGAQPSAQAPVGIADTPEAQASRAQTPNVTRRWNAETVQMETVEAPREVTTNVPPEAQERMMQQSGASRTARTGETGVGITPPPTIEGEVTYVNPEVIQEEINALRAQLKGMPANSPRRKTLNQQIKDLMKRKREFSSRTTNRRGR